MENNKLDKEKIKKIEEINNKNNNVYQNYAYDIHYLSKSNEELVSLINVTDDVRLWDELDKRTQNLYGWIMRRVVHPYYRENMYDDIMSILKIGWVKAVKTFDINKATAGFIPYCSFIMKQNYVMFAEKITKEKIGQSVRDELFSSINIDGYEEDDKLKEGCINIILQSDGKEYDSVISNDYMERLLKKLEEHNKIQYITIKEHCIGGKTQRELGLMLNLSQSYISRNKKKGISFLKKEIMNTVNES